MHMDELPALEVVHLSKEYVLEHSDKQAFKALNDVSFSVQKGDVVGIIGNNGSGKSTLLKILSQITKPCKGEVRFYGTVSSILDIGTNFHPELTGRENVLLHLHLGAVNKSDIECCLKKVHEFSEIGNFFEQPVKVYSSGMFLRLAFSMAFHLSSDILLLDEVLSVGDEGFRLKCQDMLKQLTKEGKTILFVSHNRSEILELSSKCIWLEKGQIKRIGNASSVLSEYFSMHRDNYDGKKNVIETQQMQPAQWESTEGTVNIVWCEKDAPGNEVMSIRQLSVLPEGGGVGKLLNNVPIQVRFVIDKHQAGVQIGAFFFLQDVFYQPVLVGHFLNNISHNNFSVQLKDITGLMEIVCVIPANFLAPGKYYLLPRFGMEKEKWKVTSEEAFRFSDKLHFTLHEGECYVDFVGDISKGSVRPKLEWNAIKIE